MLGSLLAMLGSASASGAGLKTGTGTTSIPVVAPFIGTAFASCPSGKAVSGGFQDIGHDGTGSGPEDVAYSSFRSGTKSWRSSGDNFGSVTGTWNTYVYCSTDRSLKKLKAAFATVAAPVGGAVSVTAQCPSGHKVIFGGFDSPGFGYGAGGSRARTYRSVKSSNRSWTVAAHGAGTGGTLVAYAYCRKGGSGLKTRSATVTVPNAAPYVGAATAECKSNERVLSGGFDAVGFNPNTGVGPTVYPYESLKSGSRSWRVAGDNFSSVAPGSYVAYAYCQKK